MGASVAAPPSRPHLIRLRRQLGAENTSTAGGFVAECLAYYVEWHLRRALAPVLFDDHDREAGERQRSSVVRPAQRSPAAQKKAASKRTADDLPVHSFRSLIADLGTLTVNMMQVAEGGSTFSLPTQPTPVQQRCFELLGVSPRM